MESKFWSLKGGPHLSATALSLSCSAPSSWPGPSKLAAADVTAVPPPPQTPLAAVAGRAWCARGRRRPPPRSGWLGSIREGGHGPPDLVLLGEDGGIDGEHPDCEPLPYCISSCWSPNLFIRTNPCFAPKIIAHCIRMIFFLPLQFGRR